MALFLFLVNFGYKKAARRLPFLSSTESMDISFCQLQRLRSDYAFSFSERLLPIGRIETRECDIAASSWRVNEASVANIEAYMVDFLTFSVRREEDEVTSFEFIFGNDLALSLIHI